MKEFYQTFLMPSSDPIFVTNLIMEVKDSDLFGKDDVAGSARFELSMIKKGVYAKPFWTHIYGAPSEAKSSGDRGKAAADMNKYPDLGKFDISSSDELQWLCASQHSDERRSETKIHYSRHSSSKSKA